MNPYPPNWTPEAGGYPPNGYPQGGYPPPGHYPPQPYYGPDPQAPFGRDPATGQPLSDKSKMTAGLLQLFLGGFGVGRFYLGSTNIAIGQLVTWFVGFLLLFLYGIGAIVLFGLSIWALVDAIMIFTGSVRDQYGRPLRP